MRILKDSDYKLFEQIASLKQTSLLKTMYSYLQRNYEDVIMTNDYVIAAGDIPIALVAHLDTVFPSPPTNIYYDTRKNVMWSPEGLGADDRAGVFAIIKIIKAGYKPHIIFTTDEEKGALGAGELIKDWNEPFAEMKYIIQLDRRGANDCVFYDCCNDKFVEYVESFGFVEAFGSFSDISEICPSWGIAGVNLSVGYNNEHSVSETLHIGYLLSTIDKVINMLKSADECEQFNYIPSKFSWYEKYSKSWFSDEYINCSKCHMTFSEYELIPVKGRDGKTKFYCPDCVVGNVQWCLECGEAFEINPGSSALHCMDCGGAVKCKV